MRSATVQRTHWCASVASLSIFITFLTAPYVLQQYKENAILPFHGNSGYENAPKCYVIRTLPIWFKFVEMSNLLTVCYFLKLFDTLLVLTCKMKKKCILLLS